MKSPKVLLVWVVLAAVAGLAVLSFWPDRPPASLDFHLIITGITKGRYLPYQNNFPPHEGKMVGGIAHFAPALNRLRQELATGPQAVISLGGEITGSPEAYFTKGEFVVQALNTLQPQAMLVGNMEFSFGAAHLRELAGLARFPFLSSNVLALGTNAPPPFITPEVLLHPLPGFSVALVGLTPPSTGQMTMQSNIAGLTFLPPGPELAAHLGRLRQSGANLIVLASQYHRGTLTEAEWVAIKSARPDVFLMLDFDHLSPEPFTRDGILVKYLNGYNHGKEIDVLTLHLAGTPLGIASATGRRLPILCDQIPPDKAIDEAFRASRQKIEEVQNEKVGEFAADLLRQYSQECPIGNLVADAMFHAAPCDIALQNSGGIQSNIRQGAFTLGDLYKILPFDNELITMDLPGIRLQELFIQAASLHRGVLQISGGSYAFINRGENDFEVSEILIAGKPLVATATYRVTTNAFLAEGGDDFQSFRRGRNLRIGPFQRETVRRHIEEKAKGGPIRCDLEGRIRVQ